MEVFYIHWIIIFHEFCDPFCSLLWGFKTIKHPCLFKLHNGWHITILGNLLDERLRRLIRPKFRAPLFLKRDKYLDGYKGSDVIMRNKGAIEKVLMKNECMEKNGNTMVYSMRANKRKFDLQAITLIFESWCLHWSFVNALEEKGGYCCVHLRCVLGVHICLNSHHFHIHLYQDNTFTWFNVYESKPICVFSPPNMFLISLLNFLVWCIPNFWTFSQKTCVISNY